MRAFRFQLLQGARQIQSRLARQSNLSRLGCRAYAPTSQWRRSNSTESTGKEKPFYVTTPIFYVNAAPHIGHLYTMVLADVIKRWKQISGHEAYLATGTDEHGMKIQQAALGVEIPPKEFCDNNAHKFKDLAEHANISHDFFIRTTDQEHKDVVQQFWLLLKARAPEGLGLYKGKHEGWYCVSDECFYPEDLVQSSISPQTGRKIMVSKESGNKVEWVREDTWFFPLSKYKEKLLQFYDENPNWIQPADRMNEVRNWVQDHLEDLSVTRPAKRLSWGVKDPEDPDNTIYVWVDALVNYLTTSGFGTKWQVGDKDTGIWPADMHVVGKDIIRFHAIYWPALLMAAGLPLPKKILCHNHWTMSNRKMSKSVGNVVNPFFAVQRWGLDALRYFLMRNGNYKSDSDYANESIAAIYEKDLQANIGNLFNRIARVRKVAWSTIEAVEFAKAGRFENLGEILSTSSPIFLSLEKSLQSLPEEIRTHMDQNQVNHALQHIFWLLQDTNRFVSETEPWKIVKEQDANARTRLNWVIYRSAEALRIAGILLQPVMPEKATQLLDGLGVKPERRTVEYARPDADLDYGTEAAIVSQKPDAFGSMFPPVAGIELPDFEVVAGMEGPKNRLGRVVLAMAEEIQKAREGEKWRIEKVRQKKLRLKKEAEAKE
ncbi:probable METHIONYL-TRNA SYNTHETASE, mitochondrial [Fusarium fujikuroi]|uniref:Probable methionine--tRNA ligase, mitochondrial n=1 Tax=Gibberella fujikuroi (strain CBS 195.34 / IMI 58289 / NRRL A-6831) TaxID=1279085 RepID=S0DZS6_GIBF5|nr:probable METHIONYL-TRNA SYNTHETASE, mitochondrial [Fusarium fujikuroi IMI 58289]KLO96482.1 putative METHIONYL-TRNA SYNTHETASE, mitochondrial [Fusarium fujikuroi]KLP20208.1 putative METHIONYL-TRNA SYNTHETASE, mitochondrial [Fusarium fujikuroi]CCT66912.1 probable METHIONYL-TRNA SYNTHETASE, mitochondrial [Fusarium fujikuroi IMI 58289]SCN80719.1 probable METHIONYL-TRNA SYNTHETASE, mitochondrial [Fusarium fujikuroi]SCN91791.1 probable METHIONYL-TRNA SYNTHETASE, mitochondrial [Fusarium fujikuroi]